MADGGFVYIDPEQTLPFYTALLERLGEAPDGTLNASRLSSHLERCMQMAQGERGDLVRLFSHLALQLMRDKERTFSKRPLAAATALLLAWLHRNGVALVLEPDEFVGIMQTIAGGGVYLEDVDGYLRQYTRQVG